MHNASDSALLHHACMNGHGHHCMHVSWCANHHMKNMHDSARCARKHALPAAASPAGSTELNSSSNGRLPGGPTLFQSMVEFCEFRSVCQGALWSPIQSYLHAWQHSQLSACACADRVCAARCVAHTRACSTGSRIPDA